MTYRINEKTFGTKSEISEFCRQIINRTPDDKNVNEDSLEFLFKLFKYHDEWNQKSKGGVRNISTQTTSYGSRCFLLIKNDGSKIDISFVHAIKLLPSHKNSKIIPQGLIDFKSGARNAVKNQIFQLRDEELKKNPICPLTGVKLNRSNCHVDHMPPKTFETLLFEFCKLMSINPLNVTVESTDGVVAELTDLELKSDWYNYHQENAVLRIISGESNLQLKKVRVPWDKIIY